MFANWWVVRVMYLLRMDEITSESSGVCLRDLESENDLEKKNWTLKTDLTTIPSVTYLS